MDRYFDITIRVRECSDCPYFWDLRDYRSCLAMNDRHRFKDRAEGQDSLPDWCPKLLTKTK